MVISWKEQSLAWVPSQYLGPPHISIVWHDLISNMTHDLISIIRHDLISIMTHNLISMISHGTVREDIDRKCHLPPASAKYVKYLEHGNCLVTAKKAKSIIPESV